MKHSQPPGNAVCIEEIPVLPVRLKRRFMNRRIDDDVALGC